MQSHKNDRSHYLSRYTQWTARSGQSHLALLFTVSLVPEEASDVAPEAFQRTGRDGVPVHALHGDDDGAAVELALRREDQLVYVTVGTRLDVLGVVLRVRAGDDVTPPGRV